ncbi:MAG: ABC transporter permease [Acidobacteriaceae bacterium]
MPTLFPGLLQDLRYALRQLLRSPGFAITAIVTLALGIGANVVVFSVLNSLLLHPLHLREASRLYTVQHAQPGYISTSYPDYKDLRDRNTAFSALGLYRFTRFGLETKDGTQAVWGNEVSGNYFNMLGVRPALGRLIQPDDDKNPGASSYAVLSYGCWRDRYAGDPKIVGRTVEINKRPYTVLGVAPKIFHGTERILWPEIYVPVMNQAQLEGGDSLHSRGDADLWVIGKLKPDVTPEQATANLNAVAAGMAREHPVEDDHMQMKLVRPGLVGDILSGPVHGFLLGMMLLAGLVLLAACTNLGSLFAARAADRSRELAIRVAVGAGRARIFRQLLTESIVASLLGGAAGCLIAVAILQALSNWHLSFGIPMQVIVSPNAAVYVFSFLLSLGAGVLFGLIPARQIWRADPNLAIKNGPSTELAGHKWAMRDLLLAAQIALCCVLVTSSLVALRGLARALHSSFGFNPAHVTVVGFDLRMAGYSDDQSAALQRRLLDQVSRLPGVTAAAYANNTPLGPGYSNTNVYPPGTTAFNSSNGISASYFKVSPGYIQASGTRLLAGRDFNWHDDAKAPRVVLINQLLAHKLFGNKPAAGQFFPMSDGKGRFEVIGVIENGKYDTLSEDPTPAIFYSILQNTDSTTTLLVRSERDPQQMAPEILAAVHHVDRNLPIYFLSSWQDQLALPLFPARVATAALGGFGGLGILLALTGIFGLASYTVSRRMRELGIRVALGASHRQALGAALRRPVVLLGAGSMIGLALGIAASRLLASVVYQASPNDPLVLAGVVLTMMVVGVLATWIPARRVLSIDPIAVLREQ